jgi:hypothetical protein
MIGLDDIAVCLSNSNAFGDSILGCTNSDAIKNVVVRSRLARTAWAAAQSSKPCSVATLWIPAVDLYSGKGSKIWSYGCAMCERNDVLNHTCLSWACILFIDDQYNVGVRIGSMIRLIRFMCHDR